MSTLKIRLDVPISNKPEVGCVCKLKDGIYVYIDGYTGHNEERIWFWQKVNSDGILGKEGTSPTKDFMGI